MKVLVLRASGEEETHEVSKGKLFEEIERLIGASALDKFICLDRDRIVWVNDMGLHMGLPVNVKATALYAEKCGGRNQTPIVGDVAITRESEYV